MQETDAVSCLLCLEADEYGSMIKVCVPPGRIPPSPEKVICRRCIEAIGLEVRRLAEEGYERVSSEQSDSEFPERDLRSPGDSDFRDRDAAGPGRGAEEAPQVDRSELENATDSSTERSAGRVTDAKTDD